MTTRSPLLAAMLLLSLALPAHAEQTITVTAIGEASVKPDQMVLTGVISESSEKMKDAVTAFRDSRRRAIAAINEAGIENLGVSTSALSVSLSGGPQMNPFGGEMPDAAPAGQLMLSQTVTLTVGGVDQLDEQALIDLSVTLIESAKEAGIDLETGDTMQNLMMMEMGMGAGQGQAPILKISDPEAANKAATKAAVDKARADAAYLAELADGKLGPVVRIGDAVATSEGGDSFNPYTMIFGMMKGEDEAEPYSSKVFEPITVVRPLTITFKLITE